MLQALGHYLGHYLLFILAKYPAPFVFSQGTRCSHVVQETSTSQLSRQFFILLLLLFILLRNPASTLDLWSCCTFTTDISRNSSISRFCCDFLQGKRKQRKSFSSPGKYWQQGWTTQLCTCLQEKGANITDAKLSCNRKSAKLGLLPKSLRDSISLRLW